MPTVFTTLTDDQYATLLEVAQDLGISVEDALRYACQCLVEECSLAFWPDEPVSIWDIATKGYEG